MSLVRGTVVYDHDVPEDYSAANSECTPAELQFVDDSLAAALPAIEWSRANEHTGLFRKWFGSSSGESDDDVRSRINDATWMMSNREGNWTPMCCKSGNGACGPSC